MEIIELVVRFLAGAFMHLYLVIAALIGWPVPAEWTGTATPQAVVSPHEDPVGPFAAFESRGGQISATLAPEKAWPRDLLDTPRSPALER